MKKATLVLALAAIMLLGVASVAFASQGDSTWLTPTGDSPHGGYSTSTTYCGVCHSVHNANLMGEALLQSSRDDACTYCHITDDVSTLIVYGGNAADYTNASANAHDTDAASGEGVACKDCHQVHGATDMMWTASTYLTSKILKIVDPAFAQGGVSVDAAAVTGLGTDDDADVSKWCSQCHQYYETAKDGTSHVMTTDLAPGDGDPTGLGASAASVYCASCHSSEAGTSSWPHYTAGVRFLETAADTTGGTSGSVAATDAAADGICLRCHRDGAGSGVGVHF